MDDYPDDWDQGDEEYDSDDNVAITPTGVETDVIFEDDIEQEHDIQSKELKTKISQPIMHDYEMSNILEKRQSAIDKGSLSTMEKEIDRQKITSSYEIALLEFKNGKLPKYNLIRKFDRGYYEVWNHSDFLYFPKI